MKFVIYKDYKAGGHPKMSYDYQAIEAADLEDAIAKADELWEAESDDLYLMRIMKKVGGVTVPYHAGYKYETYEAVLCRRSYGWHLNTVKNSEGEHRVHLCKSTSRGSNEFWFEIE